MCIRIFSVSSNVHGKMWGEVRRPNGLPMETDSSNLSITKYHTDVNWFDSWIVGNLFGWMPSTYIFLASDFSFVLEGSSKSPRKYTLFFSLHIFIWYLMSEDTSYPITCSMMLKSYWNVNCGNYMSLYTIWPSI